MLNGNDSVGDINTRLGRHLQVPLNDISEVRVPNKLALLLLFKWFEFEQALSESL